MEYVLVRVLLRDLERYWFLVFEDGACFPLFGAACDFLGAAHKVPESTFDMLHATQRTPLSDAIFNIMPRTPPELTAVVLHELAGDTSNPHAFPEPLHAGSVVNVDVLTPQDACEVVTSIRATLRNKSPNRHMFRVLQSYLYMHAIKSAAGASHRCPTQSPGTQAHGCAFPSAHPAACASLGVSGRSIHTM